ncbi:MAG: A/G-specific adenine glycosylase [Phycisphaerae bacterium]
MAAVPLDQPRALASFRRALLAWYRRSARDLPWRRTKDPYRIWLSEMLLQQTRVETASPYYERFVRELPTVQALAAAPLDRVLKLWEGLGYYTRARNLHRAARQIVVCSGGRLPQDVADWQALPGIGPYAAAAIASIAHGQPCAAVDGNVRRVLARLVCLDDPPDTPRARVVAQTWADRLLARRQPGDFNQAMMELGARICRPRGPDCERCPVQRWCGAYAAGLVDELPRRRQRPPVPRFDEVAGLIQRRGRLLLVKRPPTGLLGGLWELPGGEVRAGETPADALVARLSETLGIDVADVQPRAVLRHAFTHRAVRLHVCTCRLVAGRAQPVQHTEAKWITPSQVDDYALTRLTRSALADL